MAKKKKHRKTRKQKLARSNQARLRVESEIKTEDSSVLEKTHQETDKSVQNITSKDRPMNSLDYVKKDVKSSLILAGFIIAAFGLIYFLLSRTALGTQIYSIIKL